MSNNVIPDPLNVTITDQPIQTYDYLMEVANQRISGDADFRVVGRNLNIGMTNFETLWDQGGNYTYLTTGTTLYASSSSALDTGIDIEMCGLDENFNQITEEITLNGQNQVAFPNSWLRVRYAEIRTDPGAKGDVYIAELDTLAAGVPTTASKIKSKIPLAPNETGDYVSTNQTHNGFVTVPEGFDIHIINLILTTDKNSDIQLDFRVRDQSQAWKSVFTRWVYSGSGTLAVEARGRIRRKTDVELRVLSGQANGKFEANASFIARVRQ